MGSRRARASLAMVTALAALGLLTRCSGFGTNDTPEDEAGADADLDATTDAGPADAPYDPSCASDAHALCTTFEEDASLADLFRTTSGDVAIDDAEAYSGSRSLRAQTVASQSAPAYVSTTFATPAAGLHVWFAYRLDRYDEEQALAVFSAEVDGPDWKLGVTLAVSATDAILNIGSTDPEGGYSQVSPNATLALPTPGQWAHVRLDMILRGDTPTVSLARDDPDQPVATQRLPAPFTAATTALAWGMPTAEFVADAAAESTLEVHVDDIVVDIDPP